VSDEGLKKVGNYAIGAATALPMTLVLKAIVSNWPFTTMVTNNTATTAVTDFQYASDSRDFSTASRFAECILDVTNQ